MFPLFRCSLFRSPLYLDLFVEQSNVDSTASFLSPEQIPKKHEPFRPNIKNKNELDGLTFTRIAHSFELFDFVIPL